MRRSLKPVACVDEEPPGSQRYPPLLRHFYPDRGDRNAVKAADGT